MERRRRQTAPAQESRYNPPRSLRRHITLQRRATSISMPRRANVHGLCVKAPNSWRYCNVNVHVAPESMTASTLNNIYAYATTLYSSSSLPAEVIVSGAYALRNKDSGARRTWYGFVNSAQNSATLSPRPIRFENGSAEEFTSAVLSLTSEENIRQRLVSRYEEIDSSWVLINVNEFVLSFSAPFTFVNLPRQIAGRKTFSTFVQF